ncbi:serine/threonine-protein kinase [Streptomyces mesophilus]|uniref:serine/threonine-protein kinase n=1 Tax=Streptomyces mesophilus TaxID=1775132 RepID=UPI003329BD53
MSSGENTGEGRVLAGRYRVVSQLGRGGMGVVWRCHDEILGREVAVKELRTYSDAAGPELSALRVRMQREARAAARVRHPGVVAVHDVVEADGRPLIVMELVDGPSLDAVLRERGPLSPREAAGIGAEVMDALAAAHRAGVLHRDVKPGNILLAGDGRVVLTDFGIATMEDPGDGSSTHLTRSGELVGSLDYLAPERAQGQDPGPASDVWALGATLYGAVEGSVPFRRTSTWSTLTAIVVEPLPEPVRSGPLTPVLQLLMAKDPQARPDADGAARLLREVADSAPDDAPTAALRAVPSVPPVPTEVSRPGPVPPGFGPPAWQQPDPVVTSAPPPEPRRRGRAALVVAAAVAVLAAAGGGYLLLGDSDTPGNSASQQRTPGSGAESSSSDGKAPTTDEASPRDSTSPKPKDSKAADKESPTPSKPAGADGGTSGGSGNGGTDSGGSGSGGSDSGGSGSGGSDSGGTGGGAASGGGDPAPMCQPIGGGKYNCQVWRTATSYTASGSEAGVLNAGTNYFYCQSNLGRRETHGEWTNVWWSKTDDDSGNTDVWISDVYIEGGANDAPVPGLPVC